VKNDGPASTLSSDPQGGSRAGSDAGGAIAHGRAARTAVVVVNLGTPDEPTAASVRRYLAQFLSDPRVVEIPPLVWKPILHGIILRTRPAASAAKYASVWTPEGSPLAVWTRKQAALLRGYLGERGHPVLVEHAMRYGNPSIPSVLDGLRAQGATRILVLPMYPQYSAATTGTVNDEVMRWSMAQRWQPEMRFVGAHHDDAGYIDALATRLQAHWQMHGRAERLVLSFHGMPARTLDLGDPYFCHCQKTARLLRERLALKDEQVHVTFQSRFGKAKWLEPYTEPTLVKLAQQGVGSVDLFCPGFVADCLETLEEIDMEARKAFLDAGGKAFQYVSALNDRHEWLAALAALAVRHMQGWDMTPPAAADIEMRQARAAAVSARRS
jgi:protoporphyrin/coproporphyrin ferrochelatase